MAENIEVNNSAIENWISPDTYKYLCHVAQEHGGLLNKFVEDGVEEIYFLCNEKKIYIHEMWGTDIKISLD
jgi:hypothetical protein